MELYEIWFAFDGCLSILLRRIWLFKKTWPNFWSDEIILKCWHTLLKCWYCRHGQCNMTSMYCSICVDSLYLLFPVLYLNFIMILGCSRSCAGEKTSVDHLGNLVRWRIFTFPEIIILGELVLSDRDFQITLSTESAHIYLSSGPFHSPLTVLICLALFLQLLFLFFSLLYFFVFLFMFHYSIFSTWLIY